jgi:tetratricopeptide (TPR) repeat protein
MPIDTTGLPPGATFGATIAAPIGAAAGATVLNVPDPAQTIGPAPPGAPGTKPPSSTSIPIEAGPLKVGQSFSPRYHIIKVLGVGGMGAVYQAWDAELSVAVALKVIRVDRQHAASDEAEKRFKQELLLARQVTHKNVVRIHDLGEIDGIKYITMPYVQGSDLASLLRKGGKMPIAEALPIVRQIAAGLQAAHEAGVVHRDLKPANIMISGKAEERQALIMDFGISASADADTSGTVVGTLEYMAPEQAKGQTDARSDLYAFGLIAYEMLTGPRLIPTATAQARIDAMKQRFREGLSPLRMLDATIPEPLESLVMKCVASDPEARFQTAAELGTALGRLNDTGKLIPIARRLTKPMMAATAAVVALLLGGTYWATKKFVAPPKAHDPVSVLIADFDNRSGDPDFNGSLEQPLGTAVEAASFITAYKRDYARTQMAQLKLGTTLNESAARLLALRDGTIKVILAGTIERSGSGYALSVKAINPADGSTITTASASASRKEEVLQRIDSTAAKIRKGLGDTTSDRGSAASETVTAASLDAIREYSQAQDLLYGGKDEEAIAFYKRAIEKDSNFARAYSGWGISAANLGRREEAAEAYKKALSLLDRLTEREKYRMLGTYYLQIARNYAEAINNYSTLVKLYPYDRAGHGNLALAFFYTRDFAKALEEGRRSIEDSAEKQNMLYRNNYALYAMYAGDFKTAADESRVEIKLDPALTKAYLPLAVAAIADGNFKGASDAYDEMSKTGAAGASLAALGRADLEMYEGRFADAEATVKAALAEDEKSQNTAGIAAKLVVLGEAYLAQGKTPLAVATARRVLKTMGRDPVSVLAANILIQAGVPGDARTLAQELSGLLQPESRAYGKIIEGEIALSQGRAHTIEAVEAFLAAQKLADLWLARFGLGMAYVQAEHYAEAVQALESSQKRRGEATAIFLDDLPSVRYLAPVSYWLARAQDGLGLKPTANENYKKYLALRGAATRDPLAADAQKRVRQ